MRASGVLVAKGMPHFDLRPLARRSEQHVDATLLGQVSAGAASATAVAAAAVEDDGAESDNDDFACPFLVPAAGSGEGLGAADVGISTNGPLPVDPESLAHSRKRRRAVQARADVTDPTAAEAEEELGFRELDLPAGTRRAFTRVAPVHGDPMAAWDAQLAIVKALPPTHFHWEMAKLAAPVAYEVQGFATNSWGVRPSTRYLEIDLEFFYNTMFRSLACSLAKVSNRSFARVNASFPCPAPVAAQMMEAYGQLWSSKEKRNPLFRAGWGCAAEGSHVVESRLNARDFAAFLTFSGRRAAAFDGRVYFTRHYSNGRTTVVYYELEALTKANLKDGTPAVAAISYTHETESLNIRLRVAATTRLRARAPADGGSSKRPLNLDKLM